jgi:uncharacterized protein (TIGR02145 family)
MERKIRFLLSLLVAVSLLLINACTEDKDYLLIMNPWVNYGSLTDQEGNTYKTIKIGYQTWMVQNLTTTKLTDGTPIPVVDDPGTWSNLTTQACCWQNNDPFRKVTYGVLYNWFTVNSGKLCPSGWHVPSDAEWTTLVDYLGGESIAGGKLKEIGFRHWNSPNTGSTDEVNFRALPGGYRQNGSGAYFENLGVSGCWWTTGKIADKTIIRVLYYDNNEVQKSLYPRQYGFSVRCVWDY